jgi:ATP-binding cassette subfamily B protein
LSLEEENNYTDMSNITVIDGDISINNLSYSYDNKNYLIKDFYLDIKKGEKVVICAPSGSGKSTLAKLLVRYLDVPKNMIYIDSKDINDYNLWTIRENITYVSQEELLFTDSIYNNLTIKNTCDIKKIDDICKKTLIDEITSARSTDYNMLLEENGSNISGGERQRIILARALLKESKIYILDESFSEIDVERERIIINNIKKDFKDNTFIVISHRYDNNDLYDKVINLKEINGY